MTNRTERDRGLAACAALAAAPTLRPEGSCPRCGCEVLTPERAEWNRAERAFDGGEFSGAFEPEWCACPAEPDAQGVRHDPDGSSSTLWAVYSFEPGYPPELMEQDAATEIAKGGSSLPFSDPFVAPHAGAGGAEAIRYRVVRTRVLVTQYRYLDI